MANFLDLKCPKCGREDQIDIAATVWVRLTEDGTDADKSQCGDHEYAPESAAECCACNYSATVADFEPEEARS